MSKDQVPVEHIPEWVVEYALAHISTKREDAVELLDLLNDLSEVDLPAALLERIESAKGLLMAPVKYGKQGGADSKEWHQNNANATCAKILAEAKHYADCPERERASKIAHKTGAEVSYVRRVLRKAGL